MRKTTIGNQEDALLNCIVEHGVQPIDAPEVRSAKRCAQFLSSIVVVLSLTSCSSAPTEKRSVPENSRDLSAFVHKGDYVTYSYQESLTNSFCVTSVVGDEIHSTGPLVIRASSVQNLKVTPQGCAQKSSGLKSVGQVAGALVLTPFVIACVAAGSCDMK